MKVVCAIVDDDATVDVGATGVNTRVDTTTYTEKIKMVIKNAVNARFAVCILSLSTLPELRPEPI
jgi:hypothetical protein